MSLIPRSPFGLMSDLQEDMNRLFDSRLGASSNPLMSGNNDWVPAVDIHEDDEAYHLTMDLPGITSKEIEVTAHSGMISIRGEREQIHEDKDKRRTERSFGSFMRQFSMPENADLEHIVAKSEHGVLHIQVPKLTRNEPRRIEIQ